jgi:hypothetical protein
VSAIRDGGFPIDAESVVETGKPRHQADEENVDDAYGQGKNNFSSLFITEIIHEVEEEDFFHELRKVDDNKAKIAMLFG